MATKRAVIYCRVSTDEQAKGYSLPTQLEACRTYAESHGYSIVNTFKDDYSGATPIEMRPEGRFAYEMLSKGEADVLIVYRMDRLVRPPEDGDEWDIPILIRGLAKVGREIHTLDRGKIETSFAGLLIAVLDGKSAGEERRKIAERSRRGRTAKAQEKWVGAQYAPFGYRKVGKSRETYLEIDIGQAAIVRRMFNHYLGLNGEPLAGFETIARMFNDEGITPPGRNNAKRKRWNSSSVGVILANSIYVGAVTYGETTIEAPDLAIIPRAIFDKAQAQRGINRNESRRHTTHKYLLRSRLLCTCGRHMSCMWIRNNGKDYQYYQCNRKGFDLSDACDGLKVRSDLADHVAWAWFEEIINHPDRMRAGLAEYAETQRALLEPRRQRLAELPGLISEAEKQAARLAESIQRISGDDKNKGKDDEEDLSVSVLEKQLKQVSDAHKRYRQERDRLTAEIAQEDVTVEVQDQIMAWAAEIREGLAAGDVDFDSKVRFFDRLRVTVQIEYQEGVRGLRLRCVLKYAAGWRPLNYNQPLSSDSSFQPHVRSIS
jgi:site-specific DNA recombinase